MEETRVPPGYSPPLATVTDNDRTAWVFITTILGLIYSLLFGLVRVCVSWTTGRGRLQTDDAALVLSIVRKPYGPHIDLCRHTRSCANASSLDLCHSAMFRRIRGMFGRPWKDLVDGAREIAGQSATGQYL